MQVVTSGYQTWKHRTLLDSAHEGIDRLIRSQSDPYRTDDGSEYAATEYFCTLGGYLTSHP